MSKKFLITGGAGFIGSYICNKLRKQGNEVTIFDSFTHYIDPRKSNYYKYLDIREKNLINGIKLERGDIRHRSRLEEVINEYNPDVLVHLAALPIADLSNKLSEEAKETIFDGTMNILESIKGKGIKLVYASSSMIYGNFQKIPAPEDHPKNPVDVYGATKYCSEVMIKTFSKRYGTDYIIIRPSAVYGPTDANRRVSQIFVENALKDEPLILNNGGLSKLDFTHVDDTSNGFVLAVNSDIKNEVFNVTRGEGRSLKELAYVIKDYIPSVEIIEKSVDVFRPSRGALDISKAKKLLNYDPKYSLEKGIGEYIKFFKDSKLM